LLCLKPQVSSLKPFFLTGEIRATADNEGEPSLRRLIEGIMSETNAAAPMPARSPFNRRVVLILTGVIVVGLAYGFFRVWSWDPNVVVKIDQANRLILQGDQGLLLVGLVCQPSDRGGVGKEAAEFVAERVLNQKVRIETDPEEPKDVANWILGYVYYTEDGQAFLLNEELLRRGYARLEMAYPHVRLRSQFEAAQAEAKSKKLGIWAAEPPK
jgi:hypothetical protein